MSKLHLPRRKFLTSSLAAGAALGAGSVLPGRARAQEFSERRMEAIIPFSPGGGTDRSVRLVTPVWADILGVRDFRLDHSPGAGSLIAQDQMRNGTHDAHTVLFTPAPHTAWLTVLEPDSFSIDQIAWIGSYFQDPNVLLVAHDSPYQNIDEFLDAAANSDEPFTASVSSPLSAAHAATVALRERSSIPFRVVPFEGGSDARNAVAGGHVDCCVAPYWSATNVMDLTRALCIFWPEDPTEGMWDAPPAAEVLPFDMPDLYEPYAAQVSAQSAEDYPERYERLIDTFRETLEHEDFLAGADDQGLTSFVNFMGPEECDEFIADYLELLEEFQPGMQADLDEM